MELAQHPNQMILLYDSSSPTGKKTLAYAKTISNHVNHMDYEQSSFPATIWKEILSMLDLEPKDLMNRAKPEYQQKIAKHAYDEQGWLNILTHNPHLIKAPIAVMDGRAVLCVKPKDVLDLDVETDSE